MKDVEKIIDEINGTMAMEGMPLTDDDKERLRDCLTGKTSYDEMVKRLVKKHTIPSER
ncbi:antitoxin VbhA family protein [Caproiciproducens sp. LBM24188]|jgi:hypothetical protein